MTDLTDILYDASASFAFRVPGAPVGKALKLSTVCGHATTRNTEGTASFQNLVCLMASRARPEGWPMDALYSVLALWIFPRPKRLMGKKDSPHRIRYDKKPDLDNCAKSLADGCTKAGCWHDDCQIDNWDGSRRYYAGMGEEAHTEVIVTRLAG
jgi:Holliday junction resolvase RusA-like endonuclease